ncbi:thioredoxin-like protein [Meira miltonrushii]|uniref:Thioredoxin-like protein n=1 Tax=Meira miltonrushii TaxID=1280837 RepID=A0A316VI15_9BASI|nr:thioredoxin-like protein [Meira miltonrushii]PWN37232.1 thioredoxin-like protein [Meira miltonrushii]
METAFHNQEQIIERGLSPTTSEELSASSMDEDNQRPIQHGGYQTGVKGVRADAQYQAQLDSEKRAAAIKDHNAQMQSQALGSQRTWKEDDEQTRLEREAGVKPGQNASPHDSDEDELAEIRKKRLQNLKSHQTANESRRRRMAGEDVGSNQNARGGFYGHLREVGPDQYVQSIDGENKDTFVVVHIYVKYVHACAILTSALSTLARSHPKVKFLQVRAGSIGFGSGGVDAAKETNDRDLDEEDFDERAEEIVPTLLVYRGGNILANLVRVDLDEGWGDGSERRVADILRSHNVIP